MLLPNLNAAAGGLQSPPPTPPLPPPPLLLLGAIGVTDGRRGGHMRRRRSSGRWIVLVCDTVVSCSLGLDRGALMRRRRGEAWLRSALARSASAPSFASADWCSARFCRARATFGRGARRLWCGLCSLRSRCACVPMRLPTLLGRGLCSRVPLCAPGRMRQSEPTNSAADKRTGEAIDGESMRHGQTGRGSELQQRRRKTCRSAPRPPPVEASVKKSCG